MISAIPYNNTASHTVVNQHQMAIFLPVLVAVLLMGIGIILQSGLSIMRNYIKARRIGVPVRVILFDHVNPLWLVVDRRIISLIKRLPFGLGNNSFTRYNYRGWEVPGRYHSHQELGAAYILVSSLNTWLYIADPDAVMDLWRRGKEFPRDVSVTAILDVFGPNISTAQNAQWQKHRRITASSFNDQTNHIVWSESISVANDVLRYWISKRLVRTTADDLRTLSLHVMSRAGFGKSFKFQGHDQQDVSVSNEADINYKDSLKIILENCVLIFALGRRFLAKSWLPQKLRRVHAACLSFQRHLTQVYEEEKQSLAEGGLQNRNFMNSLVRASQEEATNSTLGGLAESEIYGNMFTFNFAGHDTTAHTFTFALYFLAANPDTQDWVSDEIRHVMGDSEPDTWSYSDYPRLKRCLAVLYETLRLYAPVPTSKFVDAQTPQALTVGGKTLILPPKTMIVPSYASLQTDPKYWGEDSLEWRPSRFIASSPSQATSFATADRIDAEEFITPARGTFLAWSGGARDCVGRKFSQVESVATIASLFRDWRTDFDLDAPHQ
ncbi:hypothetical protein G7054_g15223 [Neopestalotiopsis clavispora]|nr:hypothetical protein G7054_g15223 [Neopestalotiopsis clavispora]